MNREGSDAEACTEQSVLTPDVFDNEVTAAIDVQRVIAPQYGVPAAFPHQLDHAA